MDSSQLPAMAHTLLVAPASVAAHPEQLEKVLGTYPRHATQLQMLDRVAAGLVDLPAATYDVILVLSDADGTTREANNLLSRHVMIRMATALRVGGLLKSQAGAWYGAERTEAILAGLTETADGMLKPEEDERVSISLKPRNGSKASANPPPPLKPAGVGFVDFSDDLDDPIITGEEDGNHDSDDDLIDEDDLITEKDMVRPILQPPECRPKYGKRRRACKDCTCGMKEKIEAEDAAKRASADKALSSLKLDQEDLAEVDFTVQGKVGSCGNCALGDAFRCDGCPYIGLPAFTPGDEVRLLNNDVQL